MVNNTDKLDLNQPLESQKHEKASDYEKSFIELSKYIDSVTSENENNNSKNISKIINSKEENEKLEKRFVKKNIINIERELKLLNYRILQEGSNLLRGFSKYIDLLAFKTLNINNYTNLILLFPIKFCNLKGNLIISDNNVGYRPFSKTFRINERVKDLIIEVFEKGLIIAQNNVFKSIIHERELFQFVQKLINNRIAVEKTKRNKRLFIRSGKAIFKVIVDPILICQNDPVFLEKSIPFPYQKKSNIHTISINDLSELIYYLEKKYLLLETQTEHGSSFSSYFNALDKYRINIRNFSVPFLVYGTILCLILILGSPFLIPTFTNLGYAAIGIYAITMWYSYLKFSKIQKDIIEKYNIPYYQKKIHLDETDLIIINDELSSELMDQFTYECLGKFSEFPILSKIEEKRADNLLYNFNQSNKIKSTDITKKIKHKNEQNFESNETKSKLISKYSSFLED